MQPALRAWVLGLMMSLMVVWSARAEPPVNTNGTPYAIGGYDVVAYFSDQRPVRGKSEHRSELGGASWLFASAEHKATFDKEPTKYLPAYRGYCAYGVARGSLVHIAPAAFSVRAGKLYLNYSLEIRTTWLTNPDAYIKQANRNWPGL
jgi:YHS domain-containing protein